VEIIISTGILAVACVIILRLLVFAVNSQEKAEDIDHALTNTQTAIESFKASGGREWISGSGLTRETGGAFTVKLYFDADWQPISGPDGQGYTLTVAAGAIREDGLQELAVTAVRHPAYLLEQSGDREILTLSASRYIGAERKAGDRP